MAPSLEDVRAVGSNGIPLDPGAFEPLLYTPDGYDLVDLKVAKSDFGSKSKEGIVIELRFLAYNDLPPHQFCISCSDTRNRLIAIERGWIKRKPTSVLDTAFWEACYERHHHPRCFLARETYLGLVADDQIAKLTTYDTERMEKAAKAARAGMIGMESLLEKTTEELANLGLERTVYELLEAEVKHAFQTDPDLKDIEMCMESVRPPTARKRPPPSARVPQGRRASLTPFIPAGKRYQLDRVVLADKTYYSPRPCTNTATRKKIAEKREASLGDRMARLTHAQRDVINAVFSKEFTMDSVQEKLQKLAVTEKDAPATYLGRIIKEVENQEEMICFKGRNTMQ